MIDGSFFVSNIQDYFGYILKKHVENNDDPSIKIYVNEIEKRITSKLNTTYYIALLTPETIKLFGSNKSNITKDKNSENVPNLEITEVVLVHCNIVNSNYQQGSRVLYTFIPNKWFGQLLDIYPKNFIFFKKFNSEFLYIEVWFTDQNSKPLEIEDKINITLVIKYSVKYKK